jgi:isocitrate dehydrogenase (NAD+)
MMLRHIGEEDAAAAIEQSIFDMYREGDVLTPDVGGDATTSEFADALAERVIGMVGG